MQRVFDGGRRWETQEEEEFHFFPSCSGIGQAHTLQLLGKGNSGTGVPFVNDREEPFHTSQRCIEVSLTIITEP